MNPHANKENKGGSILNSTLCEYDPIVILAAFAMNGILHKAATSSSATNADILTLKSMPKRSSIQMTGKVRIFIEYITTV